MLDSLVGSSTRRPRRASLVTPLTLSSAEPDANLLYTEMTAMTDNEAIFIKGLSTTVDEILPVPASTYQYLLVPASTYLVVPTSTL